MSSHFNVKNWDSFQHYKDRNPPWIKLHNHLLDNYEFECLPDASKAHLLCIWMLASRTQNKMPMDPQWIKRKIGASSSVDLELLAKSGFIEIIQELPIVEQDASNTLVSEEKRRDREEKRREEKDMSTKADGDQETDHGDQSLVSNGSGNEAIEVYQYWCETMRKNPSTTKPTPKRIKAVKDRLKQGYTVFDIKTAIFNCSMDPWSMGNNDRNKPFNDLELICRSGEKLESYFTKTQAPTQQRNVNSIGTDFSPPEGWEQ